MKEDEIIAKLKLEELKQKIKDTKILNAIDKKSKDLNKIIIK